MAIQYIGRTIVAGTTVTIPTHQTGDLIIIFAYRDGNTTAPTVPSSPVYATIGTPSGANTNSSSIGYRVATSGSETSGTWTNASHLVCHVYRNVAATPIGGNGDTGGNGTTVTYPTVSMSVATGTSLVAGFAGHRSTNTTLENAPSLMTQRSTLSDATCETSGHDTNGGVTSWSATNVSVGGSTSGWRARTVEILAAVMSGTSTQTLAAFTSSATGAVVFTGSGTPSLADSTSSASGSTGASISGTATPSLADSTSSATGVEVFTGTSTQTLAAHASTATGTLTLVSTASPSLANCTSSASGSLSAVQLVDVSLSHGTPIIWGEAGASGVTNTLSFDNLLDGTAQYGAHVDLGASFSQEYDVYVRIETGTAPSAGTSADVYLVCSHDGTTWPAKVTNGTTGGAYTLGTNDANLRQAGSPVISLIATADNNTVLAQGPIKWKPRGRYVLPIVDNNLGQGIRDEATATNNDSRIILVPVRQKIDSRPPEPVDGSAAVTLEATTSAASGSTPIPGVGGVLNKTVNGYLTRESADQSGLVYNADWSAVIAVDLPWGGYHGYYNEIARHGRTACAFGNQVGWSLHFGSNYNTLGDYPIALNYHDGSDHYLAIYPGSRSGRQHFVITWTNSTKTLRLYCNGVLAGTATDASFVSPASIAYSLVLGGHNNTESKYTPSDETFFTSDPKGATGEMKFYIFQWWAKALNSTEATDLYNHWNGTGKMSIPATVSGSPVSRYDFRQQVGDAAGGAGTGWVKDIAGSNHLKIVNTNSYTGGSGAAPSLFVPDTGSSPAITNVTNGATGISGGIVLQADGDSGTGNAQQYYFQVDTANTFNTANLKESGWTLIDGQYRPLLAPSTTYYARVKGRSGDTLEESGWSSTISFTTRAATEWYVRPYVRSSTAQYGTQAGTSYANAWNGLRTAGEQYGQPVVNIEGEADCRKVAPGDTIWHCGYLGPFTTTSFSTPSTSNGLRYQFFIGNGIASYPIKLRFDNGTYPGGFHKLWRPTSSWGWVHQGSGIYKSTSVTLHADWDTMLFDEASSGSPTLGSSIENKSYYDQGTASLAAGAGWGRSGGDVYVRLPDSSDPGNRVYLLGQSWMPMDLQTIGTYLQIQGGTFIGQALPYDGTNVTYSSLAMKYIGGGVYPISPGPGNDYLIVEDCEVSHSNAGVYGLNQSQGNCGNYITIRRNWFHHIGLSNTRYYDGDSHCIGVQSGDNWLIEDNLCEHSGSAIELWSNAHDQKNNTIRRNVSRRAVSRFPNAFAFGLGMSGGGHTLNARTGNVFQHNVVMDVDGNAFHDSCSDSKEIKYCLFYKSGQGSDYFNSYGGGPSGSAGQSLDFQYNVVVDPNQKFIAGGGNGTGTVTINNNLYWDPVDTASTASKFQFPGIGGGSAYSFNGWTALSVPDQNSFFENPISSSNVPSGFDDLMIKCFCRAVLGDADGDGDVDAADLTYFDAYGAGSGARIATRKMIENIIAYGSY